MSKVVYIHRGGRVRGQQSARGASTTMMFNVPEGKIWELIMLYFERDVNATFDLVIEDENNDIIWQMVQIAAGVTNLQIPRDLTEAERQVFHPKILGGSWRITGTWGVAQVTPEVACWVVET